ncbi:SET domain-containing protein [Periconia macrospinosa]|uniref:SET domain-containing protein n=1 Tax=Periconia macrospinosa TaxID=97972 RepID=A0A2V1DZ47_9PLEO|nr:SET domain-containing protein [Periconia macrospinosa]
MSSGVHAFDVSIHPLQQRLGSKQSGVAAGCYSCHILHPETVSIPSWLSLNYSCTGSPQVWEARPSPGKGIGVFATRALEPGDIILAEPAIIKIEPPDFRDGAAYPLNSIESLLYSAFDTLSEEKQAEVMSLHAHLTPDEENQDKDSHMLVPIFRSNAYIVGKTLSELGLFPKGARINHSCRPNSSQVWIDKIGKRVVRAVRPIAEGEEIFATYIPLLRDQKSRQQRLDQYGFKCTCSACTQDRAAQADSDKRRSSIRKAFADFEPQLTLSVPQSINGRKKAEKNAAASVDLAKLVEEEGLADYYAQAYRVVALSHARIEKWDTATLWAHKSYELNLVADEDSPATLEMMALTQRFIQSWNADLYNKSKQEG